MLCRRCGKNVPEFLWVGDDHPVLANKNFIVRRDELFNEANEIRMTMEILVEMRSCSDVYSSYLPIETKNVNGQSCLVIHLIESSEYIRHPDGRLYITVCTGQYFKLPGQNDTRPVTLCEACLKKAVEG